MRDFTFRILRPGCAVTWTLIAHVICQGDTLAQAVLRTAHALNDDPTSAPDLLLFAAHPHQVFAEVDLTVGDWIVGHGQTFQLVRLDEATPTDLRGPDFALRLQGET